LREGAHRFLAAVRDRDVPLALISSSATEYAEATAARLGAQHAYGNGRILYDDHGVMTDLSLNATDTTTMAALKVTQFHALARALGLKPDQILALGNGANDTGLFTATRRSVLLDPTGTSPHRHQAAHTVPDLHHAATHLADHT
jgi:phosphoserine phosphatase